MLTQREIERIREIANESQTSKAIFVTGLSGRKRYRKEQDLKQFQTILLNKGEKIIDEEYIKTYQRLQDLGIGTLVIGRRGKRNRFIWHYDLKKIAAAASGKLNGPIHKLSEHAPNKVGRPRGRPRKNQATLNSVANHITLTLNMPPELLQLLKKFVA